MHWEHELELVQVMQLLEQAAHVEPEMKVPLGQLI